MSTTENILNYAAACGGTFLRKELLREIASEQVSKKERAVDLQISRLIASGRLMRKGRGEYQLTGESLPGFVYHPSETEKEIFQNLKTFPSLFRYIRCREIKGTGK